MDRIAIQIAVDVIGKWAFDADLGVVEVCVCCGNVFCEDKCTMRGQSDTGTPFLVAQRGHRAAA